MLKSRNKKAIDMVNGPLITGILKFSIPLMLSGILQLIFHAADLVVAGQFAESGSIGAVGATGPIINLIVNTFIGLSVGSCVIVAQCFGAGNKNGITKAVHTSIAIAIISGILTAVLGFVFAKNLLIATGTPADIMQKSTIYLQIYFLGSPFNITYNFGAGILRAVGETKKPLYYLIFSGIVNVVLNLVLVIVFKMGVAGVAIATVISQIISCVLVMIYLMRTNLPIKFSFKDLKISKRELFTIIKIGLPAGIQSALFSFSNVLIQSSYNSLGVAVVEGNSAGSSIDGFIYMAMNSVAQSAITFTSQNYGAKRYRRITKILLSSCLVVVIIGITLGSLSILFRKTLIGLYLADTASQSMISIAEKRLFYICSVYFLCGIMEILANVLRGINRSLLPMIVSLIGVCVFRVIWVYTAFVWFPSVDTLYISFPVSWIMTITAHCVCYIVATKQLKKKHPDYYLKQSDN